MDTTQSSLTHLHDIIIPDPVGFWPMGQGFYLLLLILGIGILLFVYLALRYRKLNEYRRVGLRLLNNATTVYDVSVVLKRVALAAFARERVASLYGDEWIAFLGETCPNCNPQGLDIDPQTKADNNLVRTAAVWIRKHRVKQRE